MFNDNEAFRDSFDDLFVDFVDGEIALDEDDPVWFAPGDFAVLLPDAAEERIVLCLEAALVLAIASLHAHVAVAGALERCLKAGKEQQCEIGLQAAADEPVEFEHQFRAQFSAAALVGLGGVGEAVAENDLSGSECGPNDLSDSLSAVGEHQGHLGNRGDSR